MFDNINFSISKDARILEIAKRVAIVRGVQKSIADDTNSFILFLLEEYIKQDFDKENPAIFNI